METLFPNMINHVTELDISFYNDPGTCWENGTNCDADVGPNPPTSLLATHARIFRDLFNGLKTRNSVESLTVWGILDGDNWLNFAPIERYNHPLLFTREGEPKPAALAVANPDYVIPE